MGDYLALLVFLLAPLLPVARIGADFWIRSVRSRRLLEVWQGAAGASGLQVTETKSGWNARLTAQAGPVTVRIEPGNRDRHHRIVVQIPGPPDFSEVRIRRPPLFQREREIEIGDNRFDDAFLIEGSPRLVLALLDADMRLLLTDLNTVGRLEISAGALRVEDVQEERVPGVLPLFLDAGRRLAQPMDVPRRLAGNANCDPEAGVRLQNLRLLILELPGEPETREVLRTACSDASPEVRLQAAKGLGAEGRDVLLDLVESQVDDTVSAEALSALDRDLSFERIRAILATALDRSHTQTAHACTEALGRIGASPGQLSLAEAEAGRLSLAQAEAGRLSLAADPAGQLSLPHDESEQPSRMPPREPDGRPRGAA